MVALGGLARTNTESGLWFTASKAQCCEAAWGVAASADGVHFELSSLTETAALKSSLDGSAILVDDDGVGYVMYTAIHVPGQPDHVVAIDRLAPDLLSSTKQQVGSLFPDSFVEGVMLFKREGRYYALYGSCCCACREGSGVVVNYADSIEGPWMQQGSDVNCWANASVCAGMAGRDRPQAQLIIPAQGIGLSALPTANGTVLLWHGGRWLSGSGNPAQCTTLCKKGQGQCAQHGSYSPSNDFSYWIPLDFDDRGTVQQFAPFVDSFDMWLPRAAESTTV